jgi:7-keto-8-aminopelargonate synthetase-like enzyme
LGTARVIEMLQERSRIFTGNTPPPLPLVNATLASLKLLKTDRTLRARLNGNTARIKNALRSAGVSIANNLSPIVAIVPKSAAQAEGLRRKLSRAGIFPSLIRYGHMPDPGCFRFAISSEHTAAQLERLSKIISASNIEAG